MTECAVCVIRQGSKFLISQRKANDHFGGYWEFPGGKREEHETLEECAVREAREEVGLDIAVEKFLTKVENPYREKKITLFHLIALLKTHFPQIAINSSFDHHR